MSKLSVLLLKEGGTWAAQCLEYDIAAQGKTIHQAMFELQRTLVAEVIVSSANSGSALVNIESAPKYYWDLFASAGEKIREKEIPRFSVPDGIPKDLAIPDYKELRVA